MAFFRGKQKVEEKGATPKGSSAASEQAAPRVAVRGSGAEVLSRPRITEKATMLQGGNVYSFDVAERATKNDIARAVKTLYGVHPRKIAVVRIPRKNVRNMRTGKRGMKGGGKKAYVYLTQGETITVS